jgi:hypothetical protein
MRLVTVGNFANSVIAISVWPLVIVSSVYSATSVETWSCFMNYASVNVVSLQASLFLCYFLIELIYRFLPMQSVMLMYKRPLYYLTSEMAFMALVTCYKVLASPHLCYEEDERIAHKVYLTVMALSVSLFIVQLLIMFTNVLLYIKRRIVFWHDMQQLEQILTIHSALMSLINEPFDPDSKNEFSKYWVDHKQSDFITTVSANIPHVISDMTSDIDGSRDGKISRAEFNAYIERLNADRHRFNVCCTDSFRLPIISPGVAESAWKLLSNNGFVNETSILHMMSKVAQARRRFSYMLLTDNRVTIWQVQILVPIVFGMAGVLIAQLWGYSAFSTNLDLFKLYIIIISWAVKVFERRLLFVAFMSTNRPYNIGDVLIIHGGVHKEIGAVSVKSITMGYTLLVGTKSTWMPNDVLVGSSSYFSNLTSSPCVVDSTDVEMSHVIEDEVCTDILDALSLEAEKDMQLGVNPDKKTMRTEWTRVNLNEKVLRVFFEYNQVINDVGVYVTRWTRIRNLIDRVVNDRIAIQSIISTIGAGGAFNNRQEVAEHIHLSALTRLNPPASDARRGYTE